MPYTPQGEASQPLRGARKIVATPLAVEGGAKRVHPGIAWLQRAEVKIFLVRTGEESVEQAILDLAPGFFELVPPPPCGCRAPGAQLATPTSPEAA